MQYRWRRGIPSRFLRGEGQPLLAAVCARVSTQDKRTLTIQLHTVPGVHREHA